MTPPVKPQQSIFADLIPSQEEEEKVSIFADLIEGSQVVELPPLPPVPGDVVSTIGVADRPPADVFRPTYISPTILGPGPIAEGLRVAWHGLKNPIETTAGIAELPFVIGFQATKDLVQNSALFSEDFNNKTKELLGEMSPDEQRAARRGVLAFALAPMIGMGVGTLIRGALAGGLAETSTLLGRAATTAEKAATRSRGLIGEAGLPKFGASLSDVIRGSGRFPHSVALGAGAKVGAISGLTSFAEIHAGGGREGHAAAIGFGLLMAPFVIGLTPFLLLRGRTPSTVRATDIASYRQLRAFEEIGFDRRLPPGRGPVEPGEGFIRTPELSRVTETIGRPPGELPVDPMNRPAYLRRAETRRAERAELDIVGEPISDIQAQKMTRAVDLVGAEEFNARIDRVLSERGRESVQRTIRVETDRILGESGRVDFELLARGQRGAPEAAMREIQRSQISPTYARIAEDVGDLTHRMSTQIRNLRGSFVDVQSKVQRAINRLSELDLPKARQEQLQELAQGYANAHGSLPVTNEIQTLARDAAVSIGKFDFPLALQKLQTLNKYLEEGQQAWEQRAREGLTRPERVASEVEIASATRELTPEALRTAEVGELPKQAELSSNEIVARNFTETELDVISTILRSHGELKPEGVTILTGIENLGEIIPRIKTLLPEGSIFSTFKRPDGSYDVAVGGVESKLKGSQAQFEFDGHYEGETVAVDGRHYEYVNSGMLKDAEGKPVNVAWVRHPDAGVDVLVPWEMSRVRRSGWANEKPVERLSEEITTELKEVLSSEEYQAYRNAIDLVNPTDGTIAPSGDLASTAASNNFKVKKTSPGRWTVSDQETGMIVKRGFKSPEEAEAFINDSMQDTGPEFVGGSNLPPDVPVGAVLNAASSPPPGSPLGGLQEPLVIPKVGLTSSTVAWVQNAMALHAKWITDTKTRVEALDKAEGSNALNVVFFPTQRGTMRSQAAGKPWLERAKKIEKATKVQTEREREIIFDYLETMSYEEMVRDGLQVNRKPTSEEIRMANEWARGEVRVDVVGEYRLEIESVLEGARLEKSRAGEGELTSRETEALRNELRQAKNMSDAEMRAVEQTGFILEQDMNEMSLYNVRRMTQALLDRDVSRAEFARDNNMPATHLKAARELEQIYKELAEELGIDDFRQLRGFINHIREHGAGDVSTAFLNQRAAGELGRIRQFVSDQVRTGEINQFNTDPFTAIATYIKTGFDNIHLKEAWDTANEYIKSESIRRHGEENYAATNFFVTLDNYMKDLRGLPSAGTANANAFFAEALRGFGVQLEGTPVIGKVFRRGEGAAVKLGKSNLTHLVNGFLSLHTASAMALRTGLGNRDFYDYMQAYGSRVGFGRALKVLTRTNPITPEGRRIVEQLRDEGVIAKQHHIEFGLASESTRTKLNRLAELGLQGSLQPMYHEWVQAAAYLDMWETVPRELGKVKSESNPSGTQTLNQAYERIKAKTFDTPVLEEFDRLVKAEKIEEAARYLGEANALEISGRFGLGNNPEGWRTNKGRLLTQFGNWPVFRRTQLLRGLSIGTRKDRLGFAARHAISQAVLFGMGKTFGFDLSNWYTVPGLFFTGSPVFQHAINFGYMLGGSDNDKVRAINNFNRLVPSFSHPASLYLPGSYFYYDLKRSGVIPPFQSDPNIRSVFQQAGRMTGMRVSDRPPAIP